MSSDVVVTKKITIKCEGQPDVFELQLNEEGDLILSLSRYPGIDEPRHYARIDYSDFRNKVNGLIGD